MVSKQVYPIPAFDSPDRISGLLRHSIALACAVTLLFAVVIELTTYLPFDPEWTLLPTVALFGGTILVGSAEVYVSAGAIIRFRQWPAPVLRALKWAGISWAALTAFWFMSLVTLPGVPTHCSTFGQPPCGHEYVFNNHGSLTVTDRQHFLAGSRVLVRVFAAPSVAYLSFVLVAYAVGMARWGGQTSREP